MKSKKKKTMTKKKRTTNTKKKVTKKKASTKKANTTKRSTTKKTTSREKTVTKKEQVLIDKKKSQFRKIIIIVIIILLFILFIFHIYKKLFNYPIPSITNVYINNKDEVVVEYDFDSKSLKNNIYCLYTTSNNIPDINDKNWTLSKNNYCSYKLDKNIYYVYLKNEDGQIIKADGTDKIGLIKNLKINEQFSYLAVKDTLELSISYEKYGYVEDVIWTSSNEKVASVNNGKVKGLKDGSVVITATINNQNIGSKIIVTSLINKRDKEYNKHKKELACNIYSKEENDLLDDILEYKIKKVGYKTRAGVVEAARFLTLDFPYKINYFYENGRLTKNKVDGEGRYYHKGLYLNKSKYNEISKSRKGPKIWGCPLYSIPDRQKDNNGLDCSGFVSWALLNGGYDPGDIGAGITKIKDLTNLGEKRKITTTLSKSNTIKVGDLLHNYWNSGHIAIIVGIDNNYYYVAQAIWFDNVGVVISKYKKSDLKKKFKEVILMDKYYKKDGDITNMW